MAIIIATNLKIFNNFLLAFLMIRNTNLLQNHNKFKRIKIKIFHMIKNKNLIQNHKLMMLKIKLNSLKYLIYLQTTFTIKPKKKTFQIQNRIDFMNKDFYNIIPNLIKKTQSYFFKKT